MRSIISLVLVSAAVLGCGGGGEADDAPPSAACSDGEDNDSDGLIDFPDDLGCTSANDETEDSLTSAKCQDGRDNDGDGKTDYPADPGCFAPQADDETDDCPNGASCPQCADGEDNDGNGSIDYPDDPGCTAAADDDEFLHNPVACGAGLMILPLPPTGVAEGVLDTMSTSMVMSPCGGGGGAPALAYELHLSSPRVVEISTDNALTTADTVLDIRSDQCMAETAHLACSDDISTTNSRSKVTKSLPAGNYYVIVGAHDSGSGGAFSLEVKTFAGEGTTCTSEGDCGPGLVCRIPLNQTAMVCSKPRCDDTDDEDGDGKVGYPTDPGCTTASDNDEADTCTATPGAVGCPECSDGLDNDSDTMIDYGADTTCLAAADSSESCVTTDGVALLTMPATMGDTSTMTNNDYKPSCATTGTHTSPDRTYRLDVPALSSLTIATITTGWSNATALLNSTCIGAPVVCKSFSSATAPLTTTNLAAGTYYFVVDGYSTGSGAYTINVTGKIVNNASCESALAQSGALTCGTGYACKGAVGSRTCQPALCSDGLDNDTPADGKADYPADPGCSSPADDTEADTCPGGAGCPVCANGMDDDADAMVDWPADYGCVAASGATEAFCPVETDPTSLLTTTPAMGTTAGLTSTMVPSCSSFSTGPEKVYALSLPVPVATLVMDTEGSPLDTVLHVQDAACGMTFACDDDGGVGTGDSKITMTNVAPGNYAIVVDGYSSNAGVFNLNVKGTVAAGTACTSPLFTGGAAAILACPTACTAGVCQ